MYVHIYLGFEKGCQYFRWPSRDWSERSVKSECEEAKTSELVIEERQASCWNSFFFLFLESNLKSLWYIWSAKIGIENEQKLIRDVINDKERDLKIASVVKRNYLSRMEKRSCFALLCMAATQSLPYTFSL